MIKEERANEGLKSLLLEAVVSVCKSWAADGKVGLVVEGLLAVTVEKEVLLVNVKEQIGPSDRQTDLPSLGHPGSNVRGSSEDIITNLSLAFGPFLTREDCDKGAFDDVLAMGEVRARPEGMRDDDEEEEEEGDVVGGDDEPPKMKSQEDLDENLLKSTIDYSGLSLPYVSFDDNPSTLFANVDFDDIIGKQAKMSCSSSALELHQNIFLGGTYIDLSFKNLERSNASDGNVNFGSEELLMMSDLRVWGQEGPEDQISEVGPLNLAGPQDLSLGLDKRKFFCGACGSLYTQEIGHACKSAQLNTSGVTGEPLNLKSQPLDLSTGPIYLDMNGSLSHHQPLLEGARGVTYDLLTKHTLNSARDGREAFKKCEICGKCLFSNSGYLRHKKQHAGKYLYTCKFCHKGFFDQTNLKMHVDSSHKKFKSHECQNCNKKFSWKHHLKRHNDTCKGAPRPSLAPPPAPPPPSEIQNPSEPSSGPSLPVISNFLVSISGSDSRTTGRENSVPAEKLPGLNLPSTQNDLSRYLGNLPCPSSAIDGNTIAATTNSNNNNPLLFFSPSQKVIIQVQQNASPVLTSDSILNLVGHGTSQSLPLLSTVLTRPPPKVSPTSSEVEPPR